MRFFRTGNSRLHFLFAKLVFLAIFATLHPCAFVVTILLKMLRRLAENVLQTLFILDISPKNEFWRRRTLRCLFSGPTAEMKLNIAFLKQFKAWVYLSLLLEF